MSAVPSAAGKGAPLLSIADLRVSFRMGKEDGVVRRVEAVKGVSFDLPENTTVALVGESGSGKSVTAMSILNLLPDNAERSGALGNVLDEPATGQGLLGFFLRAIQCGAVRGSEAAALTGLTEAELRNRSFVAIMRDRSGATG